MNSPERQTLGPAAAFVLVALLGAGHHEARAGVVSAGLSVHYRADNVDGAGHPGGSQTTWKNLASNTHDGALNNGPLWKTNASESVGSPFRYGLQFDGLNDYVALNTFDLGSANPQAVTLEFWLKPEDPLSGGFRGCVYGEYPGNGNARNNLMLSTNAAWPNWGVTFDQYPPSGAPFSLVNLYPKNTFMQVVFVKQGAESRFYLIGRRAGGG